MAFLTSFDNFRFDQSKAAAKVKHGFLSERLFRLPGPRQRPVRHHTAKQQTTQIFFSKVCWDRAAAIGEKLLCTACRRHLFLEENENVRRCYVNTKKVSRAEVYKLIECAITPHRNRSILMHNFDNDEKALKDELS